MWTKFQNLSLKSKFLAFFTCLITIPMVFFGIYLYIQMDNILKVQTEKSVDGMMNKIEANISSITKDVEHISEYAIYNEDFRIFMRTPESKFNDKSYVQSSNNVKGYLTFQLLANDYINSISLKGYNGNQLNVGEPIIGNEDHLNYLSVKNNGKSVWSDTYMTKSGWVKDNNDIQIISLSRVINDYNHIKNSLGLIRIRLDADKLKNIINLTSFEKEAEVYLVEENNHVLLSSGDHSEISSLKENDFVSTRNLEHSDWKLIAVVNKHHIVKRLTTIKHLILGIIILLIVLGLVMFFGYYHMDIKRIIKLSEITKKIKNKDFTTKVNVNSKDEIGQLGMHINDMTSTIQDYIMKEYTLNIKQKESELKALQNQIDPHFLYNTLDMIRWKARIEDARETSYLIEMLSRIFRNTLKNDKILIPVQQELTFIQSYLELQSRRLNGKLSYEVHISPEVEKAFILKQLIQPLVENAIKYGPNEVQRGIYIIIQAYNKGKYLVVDVQDNGQGLTQERFEDSLSLNENHAIKNISDRILLSFEINDGLALINTNQQGTKIRVKIPLLWDNLFFQNHHEAARDEN